jgi:hypothetical protein
MDASSIEEASVELRVCELDRLSKDRTEQQYVYEQGDGTVDIDAVLVICLD